MMYGIGFIDGSMKYGPMFPLTLFAGTLQKVSSKSLRGSSLLLRR